MYRHVGLKWAKLEWRVEDVDGLFLSRSAINIIITMYTMFPLKVCCKTFWLLSVPSFIICSLIIFLLIAFPPVTFNLVYMVMNTTGRGRSHMICIQSCRFKLIIVGNSSSGHPIL